MAAKGAVSGNCPLGMNFRRTPPTAHRLNNQPPDSLSAHTAGFTFVELAVVIAIVALLLGTVMPPLAMLKQLRTYREADRSLREIKEALIGFAVSEGRLPWPDTDASPDGIENPARPTPPDCTSCEGYLPWKTLGISPTDPWGRIYLYRVSHEFASMVQTGAPPTTNRFDLFDSGDVRINTRGDNPSAGRGNERKEDIVLTADAVAAIVSLGSNGAGGISLRGNAITAPPSGTDESINADGMEAAPQEPHFYARSFTSTGSSTCSDTVEMAPFCAFDDVVVWIPRAVLINRMVMAGRLP